MRSSLPDDHKYSLNRTVAYSHPNPTKAPGEYGPAGPQRTRGLILDVHWVEGETPQWEYLVKNSFTAEEEYVPETMIFHGLDAEYLDVRRRDGINWSPETPSISDIPIGFWRANLSGFMKQGIPELQNREREQERERTEGRELRLAPGDYVKLRGDLRPELESYHNSYAKILDLCEPGIAEIATDAGPCRVLKAYEVLTDSGEKTRVYDVEIKTIYSENGRASILNWKAALFLSEAFGDEHPYEVHLEYLSAHVFTRAELEGKDSEELGSILANMLYAKGLVSRDELHDKIHDLSHAGMEYLTDHILSMSRFDMKQNRPMEEEEIEKAKQEVARLRDLLC